MSNKPRFTVIIACYQTEPYLNKALESVARQTFVDFEAICYVEESTDHSLEICQSMSRRDSRFVVATGPRSGAVATTRNYAIEHARGEYLLALDGDDWIDEGAIEKLDAKLKSTGKLDILAFRAAEVRSEEDDVSSAVTITNFSPCDSSMLLSGADAIRRSAARGGHFRNFTCISAYRTAFLRERSLLQSDGMVMEDVEWTPRVWIAAERTSYLDETLYFYRRRPNSITTGASPRLLGDLAKHVRSLLEFAGASNVPDDIMRIWANQWTAILCWFAFHPVSSRNLSDDARRSALECLAHGEGRRLLTQAARLASRPKRIAVSLLLLAAGGWQFPAKFFFRRLYYPFLAWRSHGRR